MGFILCILDDWYVFFVSDDDLDMPSPRLDFLATSLLVTCCYGTVFTFVEKLNKENGIFQGWCALTVSNVSILRVLMYAVFPSCHRGCKAFSPQHSLHFYNKIQDLEKKTTR